MITTRPFPFASASFSVATSALFIITFGAILSPILHAKQLPTSRTENDLGQFIVHSKPFLILGGELGNSSAGTAAEADRILPRLATMHINTVLMPVAWEEIEPEEGHFDFSILDHWIAIAREQHLHLVLLWLEAGKMRSRTRSIARLFLAAALAFLSRQEPPVGKR